MSLYLYFRFLHQAFNVYFGIMSYFLTKSIYNIYKYMLLDDIKKGFKDLKLLFYHQYKYKKLYIDFFNAIKHEMFDYKNILRH